MVWYGSHLVRSPCRYVRQYEVELKSMRVKREVAACLPPPSSRHSAVLKNTIWGS